MIYGIGVDDSDYKTRVCEYSGWSGSKQNVKVVWTCPYYERWKKMLQRCYSAKFQDKNPAYVGCSASEEWLHFMSFRAWMIIQDWKGKELDKDILAPGNTIYGPDFCMFVPQEVNKFFNVHRLRDKSCPLHGVRIRPDTGKYVASCKQLGGKSKHLGQFDTEEQAHFAWLTEKKRLAILLAERQTDSKLKQAILKFY